MNDANENKENPGHEHEEVAPTSDTGHEEPIHEIDKSLSSDKQAEEAQKELLYLKAEFENTRKRLIREQEAAVKFGNERLVKELFSIVDLFDRAIHAAPPLKQKVASTSVAQEVNGFVTGIEMTHREFIHLLGRFGVEFFGVAGEKFDPAKHEAVSQVPTTPEKIDTIIEVFQRGALLYGRLLKPARVVVGSGQSTSPEAN